MIRDIVRDEMRTVPAPKLDAASDPARLVSVEAAATLLAMSESYVRALIRKGRLPAQKLGRAVRVRMADLELLGSRKPAVQSDGAATARALQTLGIAKSR